MSESLVSHPDQVFARRHDEVSVVFPPSVNSHRPDLVIVILELDLVNGVSPPDTDLLHSIACLAVLGQWRFHPSCSAGNVDKSVLSSRSSYQRCLLPSVLLCYVLFSQLFCLIRLKPVIQTTIDPPAPFGLQQPQSKNKKEVDLNQRKPDRHQVYNQDAAQSLGHF